MTDFSDHSALHHYLVWFPERHIELYKHESCVIGRHEDCAIIIPSLKVSRQHAAVIWNDNGVEVRDLGSTNGTFVNGRRIETAVLESEDEIRIGGRVITYLVSAGGDSGKIFARTRQLRQSQMTLALDLEEMTSQANGFVGNFSEVGLPELVQVMQLTRKTGQLRVYSGEHEGQVWLQSGEVVRAEYEGFEGEEAFYALFCLSDGWFEFRPVSSVEVDNNVGVRTQALLVAGFKLLEEQQHTPAGDTAAEAVPEEEFGDTREPLLPPSDTPTPRPGEELEDARRDWLSDTAMHPATPTEYLDTNTLPRPADEEAVDTVRMRRRSGRNPVTLTSLTDLIAANLPEEQEHLGEQAANPAAESHRAAYVRILYEQILLPLMQDREVLLSDFEVTQRVHPDGISVRVEDAQSERDRMLAVRVDEDAVRILGTEVEEVVLPGQPDVFELNRPVRRALDAFIGTLLTGTSQ